MRALLILMILLPGPVIAQTGTGNEVELDIRPLLCVTDNRNPSCELSFVIRWESRTRGYYCVFNEFDEGPLRCWEESTSGRTTDERDVEDSFVFWMTGEDWQNRLAEVVVEVLNLESDDRRRRRRTRHVWDVR